MSQAMKCEDSVSDLFRTVVDGGYCVGCGVCAAIQGLSIYASFDKYGRFCATRDANSSEQQVERNPLLVCPFSDRAASEDVIGEELYADYATFSGKLGYYLSTYAGFVSEMNFRERGSSGGMGKWILYELFRSDLVDAVIQVGQNVLAESSGLLYRYYVADSIDAIRSGSKSAYYPVEMSEVLSYVREHSKRYAIVGIPCFIKAVRLLAMHDSVFKERIRFCIGLICGHLKSAKYADMIAWQCGIEPGNLVSFDFRRKAPERKANEKGIELIGLKNDREVSRLGVVQEFFGTNYNDGFFKYRACEFCDDIVAETADISIGDAWLPEYLDDWKGTNVVVVRHPVIQNLVEKGILSKRLCLRPISPERVVKSQEPGFRHRRDGLAYRLYLQDKKGRWRPPKRVTAQRSHLGRKRRKIYELRTEMALVSHEAFKSAVEVGDFSVFQERMEALLFEYANLYRPRLWQRLLGKLKSVLRSLVAFGRQLAVSHW